MTWLNDFPGRTELMKLDWPKGWDAIPKVNNHIHSPYSFSAFVSIGEAVELADKEDISILGINDFYVMDGYTDFIQTCSQHRIFPLLNIELIGINKLWQEEGLKINDPNNPGRTYISGKGLSYPSALSGDLEKKLSGVIEESHRQVAEMIDLLNKWLDHQSVDLSLSFEEIRENHALKLIRERHIAKVLRLKLEEQSLGDEAFFNTLEKIYGGKPSEKSRGDIAGLEEELRARLLKAGAPAFVPEDEKAFLPLEDIMEIIRAAGGIPTYPLLLDGTGGEPTGFEADKARLIKELKELGISSIEFIPSRNRFEILKAYSEYFYNNGFSVSFGTEHNTTAMTPLMVSCKNGVELDSSLMKISFNGAAFIAAHQYLVAREGMDYDRPDRDEMEKLGKKVMSYYKAKV